MIDSLKDSDTKKSKTYLRAMEEAVEGMRISDIDGDNEEFNIFAGIYNDCIDLLELNIPNMPLRDAE